MIGPFSLLYLDSRMIDFLSSAPVSNFHQHLPLCPCMSNHMGNQNSLTWPQLPHMQIMHFHHSLNPLKLRVHLRDGYTMRSALHHNMITILGDRPSGSNHNEGENICGNRIKIVPIIPFCDFSTPIRTKEKDTQGRDDQPNTLNYISYDRHDWLLNACRTAAFIDIFQ